MTAVRTRLVAFGIAAAICGGCVTGVDNPNLSLPITDSRKAEITGSKIAGEAPMPDRIWVTRVDGKLFLQFAADPTIKILSIEPGVRELEANILGGVGKFAPRTFAVTTKLRAELKAGVRYILKADLKGEMVTFWVEEAATGKRIAESGPLPREFLKVYTPVPVS